MVRTLILLLACCLLPTCGTFQLGLPVALPTPGQSNPVGFKCGGPNSTFTFTAGTDSQEADLVLTNKASNATSDLVVSPRTSTSGVAEILFVACNNVNLKCGFQGYSAVKVCGRLATDFDFSVSQPPPFTLTYSHAESPAD